MCFEVRYNASGALGRLYVSSRVFHAFTSVVVRTRTWFLGGLDGCWSKCSRKDDQYSSQLLSQFHSEVVTVQ